MTDTEQGFCEAASLLLQVLRTLDPTKHPITYAEVHLWLQLYAPEELK